MKARLTAGLIHKAQRGELALTLPTVWCATDRAKCTRFLTRKPKPACRWCSRPFYSVVRRVKSSRCSTPTTCCSPAVTASAISCGRLRVWPPCSPFSSIRPMRGRSPMSAAVRCAVRRRRHAPPSPVCPRSSGASASRTSTHLISLQRHLRVLTKFAHIEPRLSGRLRRREVIFYNPVNPCDRRVCSTSVAVGISVGRPICRFRPCSNPSLRWLDTQIHKSWGINRIHDVSWRHVSMAGRGRVPHRTLRESSAAGEPQGFAGFRLSGRSPGYFAQ